MGLDKTRKRHLDIPSLGPFLRSRTGSFRAFMTRDEAAGTTSTVAWRLITVSLTVTFSPFQSRVFF